MIKALIFDCFGVLTADKWKEFCATLPPAQRQTAHDLNRAYDSGAIDQQTFTDELAIATGRSYTAIAEGRNGAGKNTALLEYIVSKKPNYKIGLLSNVANNWIRETFLNPDEQRLFDAMVFSFEVGVTKPDSRIFDIICQKIGVQPEEAVMIDDIERYCQAAQELGMQAVVYENFPQAKQAIESLLADANR